jgi:hypothetical protein
MRLLLLLITAGLVATCCNGSVTTVNELPATVRLAIGEEVRVRSPELRLRFDRVLQDSRCPMGALCIVAGSATLKLRVTGPGAPADSSLVLDNTRPDSSTGVILRVTAVTPLPQIGATIDPGSYRVILEIARLPGG